MIGQLKESNAVKDFKGQIIMVGCGSVGQVVLPLLKQHIPGLDSRLTVIAADEAGRTMAESNGARFLQAALSVENYQSLLGEQVRAGDILLNLSIDVSSIDLISFCAAQQALYVDSSIEPWPGIYDNPTVDLNLRTNHAIRSQLLELAKDLGPQSPTAVVDHGANPGLVSHFVKQALLDLDKTIRQGQAKPASREDWAKLAFELGIRVIQISERDTQASRQPKKQGEFINTWSLEGFIDELMQPAELSLGSFENQPPQWGREHQPGSGTLYLERPGASTFARSWVPSIGGFQGMLVTHDEVFSIADFLSIRNHNKFSYRPSVMFVYHPCDDAMLSALELEGRGWDPQPNLRFLGTEIVEGMDELGVLLVGHERNAYWYGSQLSINEARRHVNYANATTMQVAAGAISGLLWAIHNPRRGVVEPEDLDFEFCLEIAKPYLGLVSGEFTDWTPLDGRGKHFPEKLDTKNPWQLQNIRSRQWYD